MQAEKGERDREKFRDGDNSANNLASKRSARFSLARDEVYGAGIERNARWSPGTNARRQIDRIRIGSQLRLLQTLLNVARSRSLLEPRAALRRSHDRECGRPARREDVSV